MATLVVVIVLAVVGFRAFPRHQVTVLQDGQALRVAATFRPQDQALGAADIAVQPGDIVVTGEGGNARSLSVERARKVALEVDGRSVALRTQATTISGALAAAGVELRPGDRVLVDGQLSTARGPLVSARFASRTIPSATATDRAKVVTVSVQRARPVVVYLDGSRMETISAAANVQDLLADVGVTVREGDLVSPGLDSPVSAGTVIRLAKARTVRLTLDGKEHVLYTLAQTVGDVVRILGLKLGPNDYVFPNANTPISVNLGVIINTEQVVDETEDVPIPPRVVDEFDAAAAQGTSRMVAGAPGVKRIHYTATYRGGKLMSREKASEEEIEPPTHARRVLGTKAPPGRAPQPAAAAAVPGYSGPYVRAMKVVATWYDASHGVWERDDPNYGTTASGLKLRRGLCATDWSVIPRGTRFFVPGYGECMAADTGSGVKGYHVDLGFEEYDDSRRAWGVQHLEIYILD